MLSNDAGIFYEKNLILICAVKYIQFYSKMAQMCTFSLLAIQKCDWKIRPKDVPE